MRGRFGKVIPCKYLKLCELLAAGWVVLPTYPTCRSFAHRWNFALAADCCGVVVGRDALWACRTLIAREQNCTVAKILGHSCRGTAVSFLS